MCAFQLFLSVDPSLGRLEYSLFPDQTLMEMLIDGSDDETKTKFKDKHGMYLDICDWSCVRCDDDGRVVETVLDDENISGSLELCYVPPKVKKLSKRSSGTSKLTGTADLTQLPEGMQELDLRDNQLTGELDLTQLPGSMLRLYLYSNRFSGEINLTKLPDGMSWLSLSDNQLTGEIDLTHLPEGMCWLSLGDNQLTGEIDLTHLPEGMGELSLENNQFSGSFVVNDMPPEMSTICARGNQFNAIAVVGTQAAEVLIQLQGSGVTSVVDENGNEQDMQLFLEEIEMQMA